MRRNNFKNRQGSALLVAMLVMGVLISISLALSSLIFREVRTTKDLLETGRAYYAAESAVEVALFNVRNNLPGWEPEVGKDGYKPFKVSDDFNAVAEYKVDNRCSAYPCFDEGFDKSTLGESDLITYYDVLNLNESLTIPLFVVDESGNEKKVAGFTVEFFAGFDPGKDLVIRSGDFDLSSWNVLSWKIYGIRDGFTENMSDFAAISTFNKAGDEEELKTNAAIPTWFGTHNCSEVDQSLRYTDKIFCGPYEKTVKAVETEGQIAKIFAGVCLPTEAKEYYNYGVDRKLSSEDIIDCYRIDDFLREHDFNHLTLTNLMNPVVFNPTYSNDKKRELSKIYYRVELYPEGGEGGETVRNYADITANGYSGDAKQSVNVKLRRGSFMPVFNFSLYSTTETK